MALTTEDIWRAADDLDNEGIKPTLAAVRKQLGNRGSYTTIQEAMQEWKSRQTPDAPPPEAPPEAVSEAAAQAGATIWRLALDAALKRLEGERQQLAAEREALEARTTEATEVADALSKENEDLRKELADLRRQTEAAAARHASEVESLRQDAATACERAANLEGQVSALKEQFEALTNASSDQKPEVKTPAPGKTARKPAPATRQ